MKIIENFSLEKKNTLGIKCIARYYSEINTKSDFFSILDFIKEKNIKYFILGLGSNVLLPTGKINVLVISITYQVFKKITKDKFSIGAGCLLNNIVIQLAKQDYDLSYLTGYPSSIGGAVCGNSGISEGTLGGFLETAVIFNTKTARFETWMKKDFQFKYRSSVLQEKKQYIFWEGEFIFKKSSHVTVKTKDVLIRRKKTQPQGKTAGCVFKNPATNQAAGFLIEQCGLKGKIIGGAQISKKHANFFINIGKATSNDFLELISLTKKTVLEKFKISLETEIQIF